jgi:hypothetical protein
MTRSKADPVMKTDRAAIWLHVISARRVHLHPIPASVTLPSSLSYGATGRRDTSTFTLLRRDKGEL